MLGDFSDFIQANFLFLFLPVCLTILDVRLSRSSVLMMSLRCSLIRPSLEILSAELPVQEKIKLQYKLWNVTKY